MKCSKNTQIILKFLNENSKASKESYTNWNSASSCIFFETQTTFLFCLHKNNLKMLFKVSKLLKCVIVNGKSCQRMRKFSIRVKCCKNNQINIVEDKCNCENCEKKSQVKTATCNKTPNDLQLEQNQKGNRGSSDGKDLPISFTCCCGDGGDIDSQRLFSFVLRSFS